MNSNKLEDKKDAKKMNALKWLINRISLVFQPEEVEVTFSGEGKNITYTYTKVSHKQIA